MFYVVETSYIGPDQDHDRHVDADKIEIRTADPGEGGSHDPDWAILSHGSHNTISEARAAIADKFGEVRSLDARGDRFESDDEDVAETYKKGKYTPMGREATAAWAQSSMEGDINADTTDERISELVAQYEAQVNSEGYTLGSGLRDCLEEYREEMREEESDIS